MYENNCSEKILDNGFYKRYLISKYNWAKYIALVIIIYIFLIDFMYIW